MADDLSERIVALARDAAAGAASPETAAELQRVIDRMRGPIRLAIAGKVKAGKSTLLNAIIGEELAPTDAGECTRIVTWYKYSDRPYAMLHPRSGQPVERPYHRQTGALAVDLGPLTADMVDHLEIGWPTSRLRDLVLIDTPGIASISTAVSARTEEAMSRRSSRTPVADAVLYLLRHTHVSDLRFLEAFHDDEVARGTPVNTIGVLSRADEIGACRLDSMEVAARVAARYQADPRLHRLCPLVVPVNGLLGRAATTLREAEYAALVEVARAPGPQRAEILLTADRFAGRPSAVPVTPEQRSALLDRLGLFGVRYSVELIHSGMAGSSSQLARLLAESSGLDRLREVVLVQFESRARILKARSAVLALQAVLSQDDRPDGAELLRRLEEITASAHEFEELRILLELRAGELSLAEDVASDLDLLMGGSGSDPASRLGLDSSVAEDEQRKAALAALEAWRNIERHPLSSRATQIAARAATRTIEGMLTG